MAVDPEDLAAAQLIVQAIQRRTLLEFEYYRHRRIVQPYCFGASKTGLLVLRAIEIGGKGRSFGKLWDLGKMSGLRLREETFVPRDPDYNPDDSAMAQVICRVEPMTG